MNSRPRLSILTIPTSRIRTSHILVMYINNCSISIHIMHTYVYDTYTYIIRQQAAQLKRTEFPAVTLVTHIARHTFYMFREVQPRDAERSWFPSIFGERNSEIISETSQYYFKIFIISWCSDLITVESITLKCLTVHYSNMFLHFWQKQTFILPPRYNHKPLKPFKQKIFAAILLYKNV